MSLDIPEEDVQWVATRLTGAAGQSGTEAPAFHIWMLRFGTSLASLREDMAAWANWLDNKSPPWAAYCTIMSARLVDLDK